MTKMQQINVEGKSLFVYVDTAHASQCNKQKNDKEVLQKRQTGRLKK